MGKNNLDLVKAYDKAIKKAVKEKITPLMKKVYKKHAEELVKMQPSDKAVALNNENRSQLNDEAFAIADAMSFDKSIKGTDFVDNRVSVFNDTPPKDPLWGSITDNTDTKDLVFTKWIVDGNLMIHPANTMYRGKKMSEDEWKKYKKDYRFKPAPFVDEAIEDIQKNYIDEIQGYLVDAIDEELIDLLNSTKGTHK